MGDSDLKLRTKEDALEEKWDGRCGFLLSNGLSEAKRLNPSIELRASFGTIGTLHCVQGYSSADRGLFPLSSFSSWLVAFVPRLASLDSRARMHHYGALLMHKN